jgi:serine/threonine protein kinase
MNEQFIGNYKILEKIGAGGMAKVYLAVHKDVPNLKVVLKILSDPRLVDRFKQEADKLALLDGHGNICQIKHFFNHGDDIVIAMEYIQGNTLESMIKERGKIPIEESLKIIQDVLDTLGFAHQKKIHHRDIKPGNIMVDDSGQVKVIDFGIAKAEDDPDLTIAGAACGTPAYMAPEQFTPSVKTNYALADIYAVGTTLFYMLTGELPFKGDNQFVLRDAKLFSDPVKPRTLNSEISKDIENVILKSLDKDYGERYQATSEMRSAINDLLGGSSKPRARSDVVPDEDITKTIVTEAPIKKKSPLLPVISSAVLIAVVIGAYFIFFAGPPEKPPVAPNLYSPEEYAALNSGKPVFTWEDIHTEGGTYQLQYGFDSLFGDARTISDLEISRFQPTDELPNGEYFWRVRTVNKNGLESDYSRVFSFTIDIAQTGMVMGRIEVNVDPGGDIYINGNLERRNTQNLVRDLDTGRYIIRAENDQSIQKVMIDTVDIAAEEIRDIDFVFTFPPPEPEIIYGEIRVGSRPLHGAEVFIDDQKQSRQTPNTFKIRSGQRIVRAALVLDGKYVEKTDTVQVQENGTHKIIFDFEE